MDVGLVPLGPGVLAVGGEFNAGICLTACGLVGLVTGIDISDHFYSPHVRLSYHWLPPAMKNAGTLELDGLLLVGVTFSTQTVSGDIEGVDFHYKGTGTGPSVGLGVGLKKFVKERLFLGIEARLRYAQGEDEYSERVGDDEFSGVDQDWSQTGLSLLVFGGVRF
ncbi:uncharacterized protein STAUR_2876 [Stigmatella aurantiaca DW4/3-1]|uniref:Outer membrane protein beta-barrel domain-containing protein n=1 Tax=Stigmatella aurantiaca (strain DW4/3-1) TaxID=378806 RepID=E3FP50_STIAD|nr:uncharacterized protein STAUR_2876 [Stigmatella aurantiaca DW4/3-1]